MTVPLYPLTVPNAQAFMLAHLAPLGPCGLIRKETEPAPIFRQVNRIDGADDLNSQCDRAILSVHTFAPDPSEAIRQGDVTHRRILLLDSELFDVPMAGGIVNADWLDVQQYPALRDYKADNVFRVKAVYELSLSYVIA